MLHVMMLGTGERDARVYQIYRVRQGTGSMGLLASLRLTHAEAEQLARGLGDVVGLDFVDTPSVCADDVSPDR